MPWPTGGRGTDAIYRTSKYRRDRAALIAAFVAGQACVLCGHPIHTTRYVEAQHEPGTETLVGLCHGTRNRCGTCGKRCNQSEAAVRARGLQDVRQTNLQW